MCGIAGCVSLGKFGPDTRLVRDMSGRLSHRGPDDEGFFTDRQVCLGNRRLSLVDLEGGKQPLSDNNRQVWLTANAEIYNHRTLRSRFCIQAESQVDVGILPELYLRHGLSFLSLLDGMFALALWDTRTQTLVLARDAHGMKPLFYYRDDTWFLFASELSALLAYDRLPRTISPGALDEYCRFMATLDPRSFLAGVEKVPPGFTLTLCGGEISLARYKPYSGDEALSVEETLSRSVSQTMDADVPLGVFLSGGLDSSLVTALGSREHGELRTYSIAFAQREYDESAHSRVVAAHVGVVHQQVRFEEADAVRVALAVTEALDEPMGDSSALAVWLLAEAAARELKGVLTGDGGDELFGGYPWHNDRPAFQDDLEPFVAHPGWTLFDREQRRELCRFVPNDGIDLPHLDLERLRRLSGREAAMEVDSAAYIPSDLMVKVDRMTMAHSLEARIPFLNPSVVAKARGLSVEHRSDKRVLREITVPLLPGSIIERAKKGFGVPVALWAWKPGPFRDLIYDSLGPSTARINEYFHAAGVRRLLQEHDRRPVHGHRLWCLFVLERWLQRLSLALSATTLDDGRRPRSD